MRLSRHLPVFITCLFVTLAAVAAPRAASALIIVVRVADQAGAIQIQGESTIAGHEGEIVAQSLAFAASNPTTIGSATGGAGAGKVSFSDITLTKNVDKASPSLFLAVAKGTHYDHVIITFLQETKKSLIPVFTMELQIAFINGFQFTGSGDGLAEQVTLAAGRVLLRHEASGNTAGWDVIQNRLP